MLGSGFHWVQKGLSWTSLVVLTSCGGLAESDNFGSDDFESEDSETGHVEETSADSRTASGGALSMGGASASRGTEGDIARLDLSCCPECDYEPTCEGDWLYTDYALEFTSILTEREGEEVTEVNPGDRVTIVVETQDKSSSGYVEVGLLAVDVPDLVTIEPSPVVWGPLCTTIAYGAAGPNYFDVTFSPDIPPGTRMRFVSWGAMKHSENECIGPRIEFDVLVE